MTDEIRKPVALVTGASRGIGRAIAQALALSGRHVVINYLERHEAAAETLRAVTDAGGSGELARFDVTQTAEVDTAIESILKRHGRVEILVNNAGIRKDMLLMWMQPEDWRKVLDTNLTSFYSVTRPILKEMLLQRSGRIVNIASAAGVQGVAGQVHYSAAKAGLIGATKALANEVARRGITVNAVAPGFIETEMTQDLPKEQILKSIPMGRFGTAEQVAATVVFLCSPEASYITGQTISVNGGIF